MQLGNPSLAGKKSEYFEFLEDVFNYDAIEFQKYVMFIDNKPYDAVLAEKFITYYYPMMRIGVEIVLDFIYAYYNMLEFEAQQLELYKEARSSRLEVRKYSVKQEYVGVFGQIFELEKAVYYNYFFNYARKRNLIEFFFKIVGVITELFDLKFLPIFKDSIYITRDIDYTYMQNPQVVYTVNRLKRELLIIYFYFKILAYVVILLFFILCYVILSIFVLAVIKSNFPINSIYGVKKKDKHMSNLQDPMYIWRTFFFKNLSDLLGEDITFGIESKFIYSLSDNNKNFWLKYKIENKYVKDINIRVRRQYDILYRKFLSDEGFKNLENPERIAYTFEEILFF